MSMAHYARGAHLIMANGRLDPVEAERTAMMTQLAIEKALAHIDDPAHYPLPDDPAAPENMLAARLRRIPPQRRKRLVGAALGVFREQRRRMPFGTQACIDLGSREPVVAQVKALLMPTSVHTTEAEERKLIDHIASINGDFGLTYLWAMA
jgi:hypothetical protein